MAMLLLSLAALNMPQAMVLCIGQDGHVAIEPAGHFHCVDGIHFCDPGNLRAAAHTHVEHGHSRSCTDILIPVWAGHERIGSQKFRPAPVLIAVFGPVMPPLDVSDTADGAASSWLSRRLPSCSTSLRCTILQV